ncbi:MAG: histidine-type phosphatase [Caulobacteraceae bacterium]
MSFASRLAAAALILSPVSGAAAAAPAKLAPVPAATPLVPTDWRVERVVMVYRHGLRTPLTEEIGARDYARGPWPEWATPPSLLTPHAREGMRQLGLYDRALFMAQGLLPASCPTADQASIWTNTETRTIQSGEELSEGLAPGCQLEAQHLKPGQRDPLFDAGAAVPAFDAARAVEIINAETGGPGAIIAPYAANIRTLETILGCREPAPGKAACDLAAIPSTLTVNENGRGLRMGGPIDITSGTAEVFLLEYEEGMPMDQVGWGRATPERLAEVSRLHALLFDIYDRSSVMAHRTAAAIAPKLAGLIAAQGGPRVSLLVGHDNNIAALTAILGAHFQIPGYGLDDPPLGGALGFEVLVPPHSTERFVRVFYQAQTPDQLRALTPLSLDQPPAMQVLAPSCAAGADNLCRLADLEALLR